jgi:hypothetical protein
MPESKGWIVTTDGDRPIREVVKDLTAAGFKVSQVLSEIGSITGSGSAATAAKLRRIRGVADVAPDAPLDIGPPDEPETW